MCAIPLAANFQVAAAQDIVIPSGTRVSVDTGLVVLRTIQGHFAHAVDGRLRVNSFTVEDGALLVVTGPYPLRVIAREKISIFGSIDVSGKGGIDADSSFESSPTFQLSFSTEPEIGGVGGPGAGSGGNASVMTLASTARGTNGVDAFGKREGGGGGESGFGASPTATTLGTIINSHPRFRIGAGGGGGAFGPDATATTPVSLSILGLVAEPGTGGAPLAMGALGHSSPLGGLVGRSPFHDGDTSNDFWGVGLDQETGELIQGELDQLQGGMGGGGGGDSVRSLTFPNPNFDKFSEDKGGAGGGGGGAIHLRAQGRISLFNELTGSQGSIAANGGRGARGQLIRFNNNFFFKSGPGGGGGSGGHIVLESATSIELGSSAEALQARGGRGGPSSNFGGPEGKGGNGGPGVIQLHAPGGLRNIFSTLPLNHVAVPEPKILLPRVN